MKYLKIIIVLLMMLFIATPVVAKDLDIGEEFGFRWTPNVEPDLSGYRLYKSLITGQYTFGVGHEFDTFGLISESPRYTIDEEGTYFFVLTAFDTEGFESDPSDEAFAIIKNMPPKAPTGLKF